MSTSKWLLCQQFHRRSNRRRSQQAQSRQPERKAARLLFHSRNRSCKPIQSFSHRRKRVCRFGSMCRCRFATFAYVICSRSSRPTWLSPDGVMETTFLWQLAKCNWPGASLRLSKRIWLSASRGWPESFSRLYRGRRTNPCLKGDSPDETGKRTRAHWLAGHRARPVAVQAITAIACPPSADGSSGANFSCTTPVPDSC